MSEIQLQACQTAEYEFSFSIAASPRQVWKALVTDIDAWWPSDFRCLRDKSTVTLSISAGELRETSERDTLVWYSVVHAESCSRLVLCGNLTKDWGGPAVSQLTLHLEAEDIDAPVTTFRVADALIGRVSVAQCESLKSGWERLFAQDFKSYVENVGD